MDKNMSDHARLRRILAILLFVCLLIGLIVFCVLYVSTLSSNDGVSATRSNTSTEAIRQTTEHDHHHHITTTTTEAVTTTEADDRGYHIKLQGGDEGSSGKVLITHYNERTTGFVCSDGFDNQDARVVCKELGYKNGLSYRLMPYTTADYDRYTDMAPVLTGLQCNGTESHLSQCAGFELETNVTDCTWFATVLCYNDKPYELRLQGQLHHDHGFVEMKVGGVWGVFCAIRHFDDDVADILCRNMNYTGGFASDRGMMGEALLSKIWVPYITCRDRISEVQIIDSIFECDLVLNTENIAYDRYEHRNNRYRTEYMACENKPNSYAATVHCLK